MFSSDKNIESIAELAEAMKDYGALKLEHAKLSTVEKLVRIITLLILSFIIILSVVLMLIFLSVAAALAIGSATGSLTSGFLIVAACHFFLLCLVLMFKKSWIEKPLVHLLVSILLA